MELLFHECQRWQVRGVVSFDYQQSLYGFTYIFSHSFSFYIMNEKDRFQTAAFFMSHEYTHIIYK